MFEPPNENPDPTQALTVSKESPTAENGTEKSTYFFSYMADFPWLFLVAIPIAYALLIYLGWKTTEDRVQELVSRLWIPDKGSYARDQRYAAGLGVEENSASAFLAIAYSRDGGNLLTSARLEEVRARMEETENTKVRRLSLQWRLVAKGSKKIRLLTFVSFSHPD
jgi:hypothetical protein